MPEGVLEPDGVSEREGVSVTEGVAVLDDVEDLEGVLDPEGVPERDGVWVGVWACTPVTHKSKQSPAINSLSYYGSMCTQRSCTDLQASISDGALLLNNGRKMCGARPLTKIHVKWCQYRANTCDNHGHKI